VTLTPLRDASGGRIGTSVVAKDITELTRLQEELIRTERLAAVGELAASIAHEVKNPLAAIRAAVEILGDRFPEKDSGREVVGEVIGQIERLDRTVKDLLTFARPSPIEKQPTKVPDLVGSALELLRGEPLRKGVEVYLQLDPDIPGVPVDRRQMEQAFLNVILNSLQAMEGAGRLTVSSRQEPDDVLVSFRDTGPGVPQEIMERVFHPFFTTKHRGTGLGLSIVQKVLDAHGGSIIIENHEDRGAVVTLRLPMEARP
jgi:signal transduction histidine kinase